MSPGSPVPLEMVSCPSFKCFIISKLLRQYYKIFVPMLESSFSDGGTKRLKKASSKMSYIHNKFEFLLHLF